MKHNNMRILRVIKPIVDALYGRIDNKWLTGMPHSRHVCEYLIQYYYGMCIHVGTTGVHSFGNV
uniref:Uncharacterized protein n=1 Tax=Babesia bovis TaxID=5865 RepID=S6AZA0_BABBO|nr:hypothetical protein [Babesia bovis]